MDATAVVAIITLAGSLLIAAFTARGAKSNQVTNEYVNLTADLRAQVELQGRQIKELQTNEAKRNQLLRAHEFWDRQVVYRLRELTADPVPDPPPLDVWD